MPPKVARMGTVAGDGAIVTPKLNITSPIVSRVAMTSTVRSHPPETRGSFGLMTGIRATPTAAPPSLTAIAGRRYPMCWVANPKAAHDTPKKIEARKAEPTPGARGWLRVKILLRRSERLVETRIIPAMMAASATIAPREKVTPRKTTDNATEKAGNEFTIGAVSESMPLLYAL